jgi:glyoxylase-like metal-dependent hydrolase (beta-lactamase superfamily II)
MRRGGNNTLKTGGQEIGPGIFQVAGPDMTDGRDAAAYLVEDGGEFTLIDTGAGPSYPLVKDNLTAHGCKAQNLRMIIATHAHIDHIGGLAALVGDYGSAVAAHEPDATAIETADRKFTAANWYNLALEPVQVTHKLTKDEHDFSLGKTKLVCLHTPGHTPGSIVVHLERDGRIYLFGQDIHGPFSPDFQSDIPTWRKSMQKLLDLNADVLAEGHYGVYDGREDVRSFIRDHLDRNPY